MWRISGVIDGVLVNALVEMVPEMAIRLLSRTTVETVVLLGWKDVDEYMYVDYEPEHHIVEQGKAKYREVAEYVQEKYGSHVTNLNIAQVKDKCGFEKRENY